MHLIYILASLKSRYVLNQWYSLIVSLFLSQWYINMMSYNRWLGSVEYRKNIDLQSLNLKTPD